MVRIYTKLIVYSLILSGLLAVPLSATAQELTRAERIKILEALKAEDAKTNINTIGLTDMDNASMEIEQMELSRAATGFTRSTCR